MPVKDRVGTSSDVLSHWWCHVSSLTVISPWDGTLNSGGNKPCFSRTAWIIITQYANVCWFKLFGKSSHFWLSLRCFAGFNLSFTWSSVTKGKGFPPIFTSSLWSWLSVHAEGARTLALSTLGLAQVGVQSPGQDSLSHSVITLCRDTGCDCVLDTIAVSRLITRRGPSPGPRTVVQSQPLYKCTVYRPGRQLRSSGQNWTWTRAHLSSCPGDSWQLAAANALSTKLSIGTSGRALADWFNDFMISSTWYCDTWPVIWAIVSTLASSAQQSRYQMLCNVTGDHLVFKVPN